MAHSLGGILLKSVGNVYVITPDVAKDIIRPLYMLTPPTKIIIFNTKPSSFRLTE